MNPLNHLGSLTIFFCWIVLVSGVWLLIFFRTSVSGAYDSVEYLTHEQWFIGGIMRSLHRYASDAAIVTVALHIAKEFSYDNYRHKRWFSWVTGVPLLWMLFPLGITGYWLVWDELAQFVALSSAEFIDWLPFLTNYMARNFLTQEGLSDRFFTLMAFIHLVGLPIFFVFGIWVHVFRLNKPRINPPRMLMTGVSLAFVVLSIVYPAVSHERANLDQVPQNVGLDWFYLPVYPLIESGSPGWAWFFLASVTTLLVVAPWIPRSKADPVAIVNLDFCNGCERCVADCPFGAVHMELRSDGQPYALEARVDPELCVSCGLCVGACPTATAFRTRSALLPGIDLPEIPAAQLREQMQAVSERLDETQQVMVIACQASPVSSAMRGQGQPLVEVKCLGQLPPPFLDYAISRGRARGVLLAGCEGGDCKYRYGIRWTEERIARKRDPQLRGRIDARRIAFQWDEAWSGKPLAAVLREFAVRLKDIEQDTEGRQ